MNRTIGFTTTIPVEVIFAAGCTPCDLNNIFVTDPDPMRYVERAERDGFPKGMCNWVKGIYGVVMEKAVNAVITVMEGDCSNTQALAEILRYRGIRTIPFSYPYDRDKKVLAREIEKLMTELAVGEETLALVEKEIGKVRSSLALIDRMTWKERKVTGAENHLWLVRASDMLGDYREYHRMAEEFLAEVEARQGIEGVNIGYIGVPPILLDIYEFIGDAGGHVVYNETQRQFSLPFAADNIVDRYTSYTYPYGVFARLADIREEIGRRDIKGIIHYVQAFCFRAIEDVILRETIGVPILTVEGDLPRTLDTRTKLRIEAFIEMLQQK
ncbi:MAG: 2-hydroxyglutaryl-CoA dehydratase, D-component [Syntrophorhabdus sp. PtaU1.Bin058]|nr:MAG: 2-hydroxyglutaryl-CoA dehydratase, D-component [Syntrophorhabdus sp. PtaU1.Bin058]